MGRKYLCSDVGVLFPSRKIDCSRACHKQGCLGAVLYWPVVCNQLVPAVHTVLATVAWYWQVCATSSQGGQRCLHH
jgi:hypothetical protein